MASRWIRGPLVFTDQTVFTGTGNVALVNQSCLVVKKSSAAVTQVTLPASPINGHTVLIKDGKGDAATYPITIVGAAAATIDGAAYYVLDKNYAGVVLKYNGAEWNIQNLYPSTVTGTTTTTTTTTT